MLSRELQSVLTAHRRKIVLVWVVLAWSTAILTGGAYYLAEIASGNVQGAASSRLFAISAAVTLIVVNIGMRRWLLSEARLREVGEAGSMNPMLNVLAARERSIAKASLAWMSVNVLSWILNEAVLLTGLGLVVATHSFTQFLPFLGVALLTQLLTFPRADVFVARATRLFA